MLCYFLSGNRAFRDTAINSAEYVLNIDDGRQTVLRWLSTAATGGATASADGGAYHGPGRGPANSLNALVDGHRLSGDARFLTKAEQLIRRVIHPEEDIADRLTNPNGAGSTMFLHRWKVSRSRRNGAS